MKTNKIKLGYEIPTGEEISIEPSHLLVTGITQRSGKTTTLEALINRSKSKAVVFKTKIGEQSFEDGRKIQPFFRERTDYWFVKALIESYAKDKISIEKGTLMTVCKDAKTLADVQRNVEAKLNSKKPLSGWNLEIITRLHYYLSELLPQIEKTNVSSKLEINEGVNIIDLIEFSLEAQSLIIQAVATEILNKHRGVILVIPEAWKFLPQTRNNPCKLAVESYIRQGAANRNFIYIDSQDMANVDKTLLKQITTWVLGYQTERNEVAHTLDQIPGNKKVKPTANDIMSLDIGQFFLVSNRNVAKVYVQPSWMRDDVAKDISTGQKKIPETIHFKEPLPAPELPARTGKDRMDAIHSATLEKVQSWIEEIRADFNTRIEINARINDERIRALHEMYQKEIADIHNINIDRIATLVVARIKNIQVEAGGSTGIVNKGEIIEEIIRMLPQGGGTGAVYNVSPIDKIKKSFLIEAKDKIIKEVKALGPSERKVLKYMESKGSDVINGEIVEKCLYLSAGGTSTNKVGAIFKALLSIETIEKTAGSRYRAALKKLITKMMGNHQATEKEIDDTYNHIMFEILEA